MPWAVPHVWVASETPSDSLFNQEFRDNPNSLRRFNDAAVKLYLSANQSIPHSVVTILNWGVASWQFGAMWSAALPSRLVAPITGYYLLTLNLEWRTKSAGDRNSGYFVRPSNLQVDLQSQVSCPISNTSAVAILKLTAGEYIECYAWQTSGSSLGAFGSRDDRTRVSLHLMGT